MVGRLDEVSSEDFLADANLGGHLERNSHKPRREVDPQAAFQQPQPPDSRPEPPHGENVLLLRFAGSLLDLRCLAAFVHAPLSVLLLLVWG